MATAKNLTATIILQAIDRATDTFSKFVTKSSASLDQFKKRADKAAETAFSISKKSAMIGAAIAAPLILATKSAIDFEDAMADVAKVTNVAVGGKHFGVFSRQAKDAAIYLGKGAEESAKLMASLAQGGVENRQLFQVTKMAGEISVAWDMAADVAGDRFMKMRNALGATIPVAKQAADAINFLSDKDASKAGEILDFMASGGAGVARSLKIAAPTMAAFGSSLISVGKSGAEAGTILQRFQKGVYAKGNDDILKTFKRAGGGAAGLIAVLKKGASIKDDTKQTAYFTKFGEYGTDIRLMAQNLDQVQRSVTSVADATKYANAVNKEFANRNSTTKGQLNKMRAEVGVLSADIGVALLPAFKELLKAAKPLITQFAAWVQKNPELVVQIAKFAAVASASSFAISGISGAVGGVMKVLSGGSTVVKFFLKGADGVSKFSAMLLKFRGIGVGAITAIGRAFGVVSTFLSANPFVLVIAGVVAVAAGAYLIYKNWGKIKAWFGKLWAGMPKPLQNFIRNAKDIFLNFTPLGWMIRGVSLAFVVIPKLFRMGGRNIIKSLVQGIKDFAHHPIDTFKKVVTKIRAMLPFSPAKEGPLKDIHRIRLVETIADSVKPAPLVRSMTRVARASMSALTLPVLSGASGGSLMRRGPVALPPVPRGAGGVPGASQGGVVIHFAPVLHINGGSSSAKDDLMKALRDHSDDLVKLIEQTQRRQGRLKI